MSVRDFSVLKCVGSGLATGLIRRPRSPLILCRIHSLRLIMMGNRTEGLILQYRRRRRYFSVFSFKNYFLFYSYFQNWRALEWRMRICLQDYVII
jgi:hypothetical protein